MPEINYQVKNYGKPPESHLIHPGHMCERNEVAFAGERKGQTEEEALIDELSSAFRLVH